MGKIKVKVVGDEQAEQEQKEEQAKRRQEKAVKKSQVKGIGLGGGERVNSVGVTEEEIAAELAGKVSNVSEVSKVSEGESGDRATDKKEKRGNKARKAEARVKSKRHQDNGQLVAKNTTYPILNGVEMLKKFKKSSFDETVELHINVKEKGINGTIVLPHGTGKKLRIAIADDAIIAEVEKGKINFDVLVATPDMMPKLAKVARVLGPRGLMPNPKNGTISPKPSEVVEKLSAGQVSYKTESSAPIIHMSVGKLSFEDNKLHDNITTVISSITPAKIDSITLKSTMSPAIRIQV